MWNDSGDKFVAMTKNSNDIYTAELPEGFSNVINQLKNDKEYYNNASLNSKFISEYYSKENVAKLWREYYPRIYQKYLDRKAAKKAKKAKKVD